MESDTLSRVDDMLAKTPNVASELVTKNWKKTKNLTVLKLKGCWQALNPDLPFPTDGIYGEKSINGKKFIGMRDAEGRKNGVIRVVD